MRIQGRRCGRSATTTYPWTAVPMCTKAAILDTLCRFGLKVPPRQGNPGNAITNTHNHRNILQRRMRRRHIDNGVLRMRGWFEQHRSKCKGIQRIYPVFKDAYRECGECPLQVMIVMKDYHDYLFHAVTPGSEDITMVEIPESDEDRVFF